MFYQDTKALQRDINLEIITLPDRQNLKSVTTSINTIKYKTQPALQVVFLFFDALKFTHRTYFALHVY